MIPNHTQFIAAIREQKKVCVRFYSKPDSGVLDRVCAPMDYGPGGQFSDGLNRYWLWDYAGDAGSHTLGLVSQQIVDLQVLGEVFDPTTFRVESSAKPFSQACGLPPTTVTTTSGPDTIATAQTTPVEKQTCN